MNWYLDQESKRLIDVRDSRQPTNGNHVYIGPTAVDFGMLDIERLAKKSEDVMFKKWKEQDLASYYRDIRRKW